ncbi:MAG: OstA-like protein [Flavobacteriales bacterium]
MVRRPLMPIRSLLPFLLLALPFLAVAQDRTGAPEGGVEILNADRWEFDDKLAKGAQRLIGNARFKHGDAIMSCDSAYILEDHHVQAYGHIGIRQGDTLQISGDRLEYNGKERLAVITGNVRLTDPGMELTTEALSYDLKGRTARYSTGARIVSMRDGNTLTSRNGAYLAGEHRFLFSDDVVLTHPERTIRSDTLHYATRTGVAEFFGPTRITQGTTTMYADRGSYDTRTERGRFTRGGRIVNDGQELVGDSLHYDRRTGEGLAWGHVAVIDTANDLLVRGDRGRHLQGQDRSMITGHAELVLLMGKDSLFLHGDTLFASRDSSGGRLVQAWRKVRLFKPDLQGVCDTMIYSERDSAITLIGTPYLWSGKDQINGKHIRITLRDGHAHRLYVNEDAFMASQADSTRFDQVTGTTMTGSFQNDQLVRILAEGNTRTVYFAKDKKDGVEQVVGMNRADCSRIVVELDSGQVSTLSFLTQPDATLYPLEKAPADEMRMKGFTWNAADRPKDRRSIFQK